jgi:hypothetical protein
MQCILREKLLERSVSLAQVSAIYRSEAQEFVDAYIQWLEQSERELAGLRTPISILLQAEKSLVTAVLDGYVPAIVQNEKSARKRQRAIAAHSLERISKEIHAKIEGIDHLLGQIREKLCHAIAVLATKEPALYQTLGANQQSIDAIWRKLAVLPETVPMFNYFCAALASTDRNYVLMDIIANIVSNIVSNRIPA